MLCNECPHRDLCTSLCPEAELYASQDEVSLRELTISNPYKGKWPEFKEKSLFTKTERKILSRLFDGMTREEMAQDLKITAENIRKIIERIRKKRDKIIL